jgi:arylsulfatase A-like enzyme
MRSVFSFCLSFTILLTVSLNAQTEGTVWDKIDAGKEKAKNPPISNRALDTGKVLIFNPEAQNNLLAEAVAGYNENRLETSLQPNVIFILSDDHRYDAMGFTGRFEGLQTPALDEMARDGRHFSNAFVSTSLCSPSRATILTGQYAHEHTVIDNSSPMPDGLTFFPQLLQDAGLKTGFFGKWHIDESDDNPQVGFDEWVSFRGQGTYYGVTLNINGVAAPQDDTTYTTDLLTRMSLDWAKEQSAAGEPYFAYLSHKAVHAEFQPAKRHLGSYADLPISYPPTMWPPSQQELDETRSWVKNEVGYENSLRNGADTRLDRKLPLEASTCPTTQSDAFARAKAVGYDYEALPNWVKRQRHSWHGVDFMYNGAIPFDSFYVAYLEALRAVDESVRDVLAFAKTETAAGRPTVVIYMGDNGFSFGEHGLIDKRQAYEESMRVPMLAWGPGVVLPGTSPELVQNLDIAPTVLDLVGVEIPDYFRGASMKPLMQNQAPADWRNFVPYEYYWERAFPQTPTVHAVRGNRYKYIRYHGVWDRNEFYDIINDPNEARNLIAEPSLQDEISASAKTLWQWLGETDGEFMPLKPTNYKQGHFEWKGAGRY